MKKIKIEAVVNKNLQKVWEYWNEPKHIVKWAFASDEWECPYAENNLQEGGEFLTRMSAKDGSESFDLIGQYVKVVPKSKIESILSDGRTVSVNFEEIEDGRVMVVQEFEMETQNSEEQQRNGWQTILDNFKKYTEES